MALGKTASLFGAALAGGAIVNGAHPDRINALWELGRELGVSFQLIDDCNDLFASSADTGKHVHQDISSGRLTLPILLALQTHTSSNQSPCLRSLTERKLTRRQRRDLEAKLAAGALQQQLHSLLDQHQADHESAIRSLGLPSSLACLVEHLCRAAEQPPPLRK